MYPSPAQRTSVSILPNDSANSPQQQQQQHQEEQAPPASLTRFSFFNTLPDDVLSKIHEILGKRSYFLMATLNKKCRNFWLSQKIPKETYFGFLPLSKIQDLYTNGGRRENYLFHLSIAKGVVMFNRDDLLDWVLEEQHLEMLSNICYKAAHDNRTELLQKVFDGVSSYDHEKVISSLTSNTGICRIAALGGQLDSLNWLLRNGFECDHSAITGAAQIGKFEIVKWLHRNGCQWNECTFAEAAGHGDLCMLKWLRTHGCPWDEYVSINAARENHLEVIKWLKRENCPWSRKTFKAAQRRGHKKLCNWLRANGCPS